jgi:hypothetical protein
MNYLKLRLSLLLVLFLFLIPSSIHAQAADTLNNDSVVKLVKAGFKEKSIITIIGSRQVQFDLSTERMIDLKRSGVSEKIILAMLARQQGEVFSDEAWGDEFMSNSLPAGTSSNNSSQPPTSGGNTVDIFGSSGGGEASTKTRGGGTNSASGDVVTTGSATVKILRPPVEANAPPKLEKTKSLNNDSIIELVEAGFSEGTIIRRIEQSPVEFNLSPASLTELRKHRVTEKIVNAMKNAMGVEEKSTNAPTDNATPKQ